MKKNYSLFGLPEEVTFCKKCIISNQRPNSVVSFLDQTGNKKGIKIDNDKICSACKVHETKKNIDWIERENKLKNLCDKYRKKSGYDCIIPGSGGKDSAFIAHVLKYKYNMHPLTVTWAPHSYTDIGRDNFYNWINKGGFDNILFTPNGKLHRVLTRTSFINILHPFQPFAVGQKMIGPKFAIKFDIPLVFYGENENEYGDQAENPTFVNKKYFSTKDDNIYIGGENIKDILKKNQFQKNEIEPYLPAKEELIEDKKIEFHYLGYYLKWDPQECFYYASENTGFKPNTERTIGTYSKYSSIDDKMDYFYWYTYFIKFGLGRTSFDAAQEVRNQKITREEAVILVRKYDSEFPEKYFKDFLNYISISEKEFWETVDKFRSPHLWEKNLQEKWSLKNQVK